MALETVDVNAAANRLVSPQAEPEDFDNESSLRPKSLDEYIGQDKAKENLSIYLQKSVFRRLVRQSWQWRAAMEI